MKRGILLASICPHIEHTVGIIMFNNIIKYVASTKGKIVKFRRPVRRFISKSLRHFLQSDGDHSRRPMTNGFTSGCTQTRHYYKTTKFVLTEPLLSKRFPVDREGKVTGA